MITDSSKSHRTRTLWLYFAGLFLVILAAKLALIDQFGNSTPFWDQWDGEAASTLEPSEAGTLKLSSLFNAHGEHRIFFSRLLWIGLFDANGIWDPKVEMVTQAFIHVTCLILLIALCNRFLTHYGARSVFALFTVGIFALPFGWENSLWGFQSQFYFVSLWGLIGIGCCWRYPTFSRGWWVGVFVFSLGFVSMAGGVFAPAASCGLIAMRLLQNRNEWRRQCLGLLVLGTLTAIGLTMVHHVPGNDTLKAHSFPQFFQALIQITSWPAKTGWLALVFQAPLIILLGWALRQRINARDPAWLLITLGMWCAGQAVAIAYGRAVGTLAWRYTDNFALSLCVSLACMLYLMLTVKERSKKRAFFFGMGWFALVSICLLFAAQVRLPGKIIEKYNQSQLQETHVRAFLASNDISELKDKPFLHIPYPNAERLASLLARPSIRTILPTNLRDALVPVHITQNETTAFSPDAYAPGFLARPFETAWSSYRQSTGGATIGTIDLQFPSGSRTSWLKLSVTGYTQNTNLSLTLIDQLGIAHKINLPASASQWKSKFFHRPEGPFTLRVTDASPSSWIAFTLPREVGPLSLAAGFLQDQALMIALMGFILICLGAWSDPKAEDFARHHRLI